MRPIDSAYDRDTAEFRGASPDGGRFATITDCNGPLSLVGAYDSLSAAIDSARGMDAGDCATELEDEIGYDATGDSDAAGLIDAAISVGWVVVAQAGAGEHWTVMRAPE